MKRAGFIKEMWGLRNDQERRERTKGKEHVGGGGGLEEESLVRLITSGSKFPVNHFYDTQAILLKEEAILPCPTFHLCLTFMSSTQFYHRKCNVYLSADAILPCYHLNRAGLIIISPEDQYVPRKKNEEKKLHLELFRGSDLTISLFYPLLFFNELLYFHINCWSTCGASMSIRPAAKQ